MTLRTLRVPFNMEHILLVMCGAILFSAAMKERPTQLLTTMASAGQIRDHQLENRESECPVGHEAFGNNCYFPNPNIKDDNWAGTRMNWEDARDECRKLSNQYPWLKYDLISLQSEEEYNFLLNHNWCSDCGFNKPFTSWKDQAHLWTGLNDMDVEGEYKWSDGSVLDYANPITSATSPPWRPGEPHDIGDEDCVQTYGLEGLQDVKCTDELFFICEGHHIKDPCTNKNCGGQGQCTVDPNDSTDGYKCACKTGYTGNDCEANPCTNKNCGGQGQCTVDPNDSTDGYKCACKTGYTGKDCEANPCFGQTCSGRGSCSVDAADTSDGYLCSCNVGYIGNDCEIELKSYTWDFEDGTMQGFEKVSGDCGVQPLKYVGSGDEKWSLVDGGTYFVNTARYGALSVDSTEGIDEKKCVFGDKSHYFKITSHTEITWNESGKGHSVCLNRLSDDKELLCKRNSHENFDMQERSFSLIELSSFVGETFYFTFADEQTGYWDHIQLDNLKVTYEDEDSCFGQSCSGHGSCIVDAADTSDGYLCSCIDGYIGNDCEIGIKSYTWDFEDGTMQGFEKVRGDCGVQPLKYVGSGDGKWILADGGTYFVNTARYGATSVDSTIGTDEKKCVFGDKSHYFKITSEQQNHIKITPHTEITWHEAGKGHSVCLNRLSDDVELLCKRNSHENVDMQKRSFSISELSSLVGETCYFTFADEQTGSWDHIQLDNLKVTYEDEVFRFMHRGHCAEGWKGPNTSQKTLMHCRNKCARRSNIGYFAYSTSKTCACYLASGECPDNGKFVDTHMAYEVLREEWELMEEQKECGGSEILIGELPNVDDCATKCKGVASMFAFGTNDFGTDRCYNNGRCYCYCETSATKEGTCTRKNNNGYRLYKYSNECRGGDNCCKTSNKCGEDQGDCDSDSDCKEGLKCGKANCSQKSGFDWDSTDDCCYRPDRPGCTSALGCISLGR